MKQYLYSGLFIFFISTSTVYPQSTATLSETEINLITSLGFDTNVFLLLRSETDAPFTQLVTQEYIADETTGTYVLHDRLQKGIEFTAEAEQAYNIIYNLKNVFPGKGYQIFICEKDKNDRVYQIGVIQSADQFDILRVMETNGENYNITTNHIVQKLQDWNSKYAFTIIGASSEWVEALFTQMPVNTDQFANEVYEFCPDVVEKGSGSVKFLGRQISETGILYLWWE